MRLGAGLVPVVLLAAACGSGGDGATPPTTVRREATTTVAPIDPTAVPDEVTPAYVEAVLAELQRVNGEALRLAVDQGVVGEDVSIRLRAINTAEHLGTVVGFLVGDAAQGFPTTVRPPGRIQMTVTEVLAEADGCVAVRASGDFSGVTVDGATDVPLVLELVAKPGDVDPDRLNPTPWVLSRQLAADAPENEDVVLCAG